jgi:tetratricopeptide (TPR) repeat protein
MKNQIMIKIAFLALLISFLFSSVNAQNSNEKNLLEGKNTIKAGIKKNDTTMYLEAHKIFERLLQSNPSDSLAKYYLSYTEYLLISSGLGKKKNPYVDKYLDSATIRLESIKSVKNLESEKNALLAGFYMMKISISPGEAPMLSMKIDGLLYKAQETNPDNPRVYYLFGIMKAKTPVMFGGNPEEAINFFKKSIALFEKTPTVDEKMPDWGYMESFAFLGMTLTEQKEYDEAEFFYKKALDIDPDYGWIKYRLLPQLEKERNKK